MKEVSTIYSVFVGNTNHKDPICSYATQAKANVGISEYLRQHNIQPDYMRWLCYSDREVWIDYGSWSEFLIVTCDDCETIRLPELMGGDA